MAEKINLICLKSRLEEESINLYHFNRIDEKNEVSIPGAAPQVTNDVLSGAFDNGADLLARCSKTGASIGQIMRQREKDLRPDADVDAERLAGGGGANDRC